MRKSDDTAMQGFAIIGLVIAAVCFVGGISLLIAWPFMWLWNGCVVEALTIAKPIGYWTAFGLACFVGIFLRASSSSSSK